jgi:tetratricopeptide (TPR) repeat protein
LEEAGNHPTALAYSTLGTLSAELNSLRCAAAAYQQAVLLDSTFWDAHFNLAQVLLRQKDYQKAADEFRIFLGQKPGSLPPLPIGEQLSAISIMMARSTQLLSP